MSKAFDEFLEFYAEIKNYEKAGSIISWELHTEAPKNAVDGLVDLQSFYFEKSFEMTVSDRMGELLEKLSADEEMKSLPEKWKTSVKKLYKDYKENRNIPVEFYGEYTKTVAKAEDVWQKAKRANDYDSFKPYLEKLVDMTKQMCKYRNPDKNPYDLLLNDYEEGMESADIDKLFNELKEELIPFVKSITSVKQSDSEKFKGKFDINLQREMSEYLLEYIGFDMDSGVIAESEHPFTTDISLKDVRLTNHYYEDDIINPMFSIIHEGGHGIFAQNTDKKYEKTPLASCSNMGLHESQSRFFENILARNINFWKPIYGKIQELFPQYKHITIEEFYRKINQIKCSNIRVNADEVTYAFHIIIRYEVEKELFNGNITVDDIPELWNKKSREYLGIEPEKPSEGFLQDSHWSGGMFGYFPSYLIGSIYDGMLLEAVEVELGNVDDILASGNIKKITKWLNEKVHRDGTAKIPKELIENICGKKISSKPLMDYFREKYLPLYH